jgi:hypothetical protein
MLNRGVTLSVLAGNAFREDHHAYNNPLLLVATLVFRQNSFDINFSQDCSFVTAWRQLPIS